eukprot:scaffold16214_cov73-Phaeocystis_antarctica.AAC.12
MGRPQRPRRWEMERELSRRLTPSLPALPAPPGPRALVSHSVVSAGWPERACSRSAVLPVLGCPHVLG